MRHGIATCGVSPELPTNPCHVTASTRIACSRYVLPLVWHDMPVLINLIEFDGTSEAVRELGRCNHALEFNVASHRCLGLSGSLAHHVNKLIELLRVARLVALREGVVGQCGVETQSSSHRHRRLLLVLCRGHALLAKHLHALVVPVRCRARAVNGRHQPGRKLERHHDRVHVIESLNVGVVAVAHRIHLNRHLVRQKVNHIDIVGDHVVEDAATDCKVRERRCWIVTGTHLDHTDTANGSFFDLSCEFSEVAVDTTLVSHNKRNFLLNRHVNNLVELFRLVRDRLLSKDGLSCLEGSLAVLIVCVGR
eukprot:m.124353 g.124353  ORF g.124353 m.124353 type:complete len:308 (+) comp11151_c1_seq1:82-1005(+)